MQKKELVGVALLGGGYGLVALSFTWWVDRWTGGNLAVAVTVLGVIGTVGAVIGWRAAVRAEETGATWAELDVKLHNLPSDWRTWADTLEDGLDNMRHMAPKDSIQIIESRAREARACANDLEGVLAGLKDRT